MNVGKKVQSILESRTKCRTKFGLPINFELDYFKSVSSKSNYDERGRQNIHDIACNLNYKKNLHVGGI